MEHNGGAQIDLRRWRGSTGTLHIDTSAMVLRVIEEYFRFGIPGRASKTLDEAVASPNG
jgi:hypothetical protein